jgi:hypothetical protein
MSSRRSPAIALVGLALAGALAGCGGTDVQEDTNPPNPQETVPIPGEPTEGPS